MIDHDEPAANGSRLRCSTTNLVMSVLSKSIAQALTHVRGAHMNK